MQITVNLSKAEVESIVMKYLEQNGYRVKGPIKFRIEETESYKIYNFTGCRIPCEPEKL